MLSLGDLGPAFNLCRVWVLEGPSTARWLWCRAVKQPSLAAWRVPPAQRSRAGASPAITAFPSC